MRSEQPSLDQLFEATRTVERRAHAECMRLRGTVAARLSAAGVSLSTTAIAGAASTRLGTAVGHAAWLTAAKSKVLLGLILLGSATTGGVLVLRPAPTRSNAARELRAAPMKPLPMFPRSSIARSVPLPMGGGWQGNGTLSHALQPSAKPDKDALAEELELVRGAQSELTKGRSARVLALLDRYFQRFPSGILQPEAKATKVRALCLAGRTVEAEREAARFAQTNPDSPLVARSRTCKAP